MKVIQPNCRIQFTADDISFITSTLGGSERNGRCLVQLLADEETRDQILDDELLFQTLLEHRGCLQVSDHLYFYLVVRHVLFQRPLHAVLRGKIAGHERGAARRAHAGIAKCSWKSDGFAVVHIIHSYHSFIRSCVFSGQARRLQREVR